MFAFPILEDIVSKPIAVIGLGISNFPLIDYLLNHGAKDVTARDRKEFEQLPEAVRALGERGVRFVLGEDYLKNMDEATIFRSPGIRPDEPALLAAMARGARITSEMRLFFELCPAHIFGITGSDGKTTTTTLTKLLLEGEAEAQNHAFRVFCGGNIGQSLLPFVDEMTENDYAVVELSSFQLMDMTCTPEGAVITNITPNHLNWHPHYDEYIAAKHRIVPSGGRIVLNADNEETVKLARALIAKGTRPVLFSSRQPYSDLHARFGDGHYVYLQNGWMIYTHDGISEPLLKTEDILIPGRHNIENYMAATALTYTVVRREVLRALAPTFSGVRHRLQHIRTLNGVKYYNSSIDSSPTRTRASLLALDRKPIVICGGAAKGLSFDELADTLVSHAKAVVLTGATAGQIEEELLRHPFFDEDELTVRREGDFKNAVLTASSLATEGDIVLLSPACTSFDAFKNFEERGDVFSAIVRELPERN